MRKLIFGQFSEFKFYFAHFLIFIYSLYSIILLYSIKERDEAKRKGAFTCGRAKEDLSDAMFQIQDEKQGKLMDLLRDANGLQPYTPCCIYSQNQL